MGGYCRRSKVSTSNIYFDSSLPAKTYTTFEVEHTLRNLGGKALFLGSSRTMFVAAIHLD
jgi:hypothetical protein